LKVYLRASRYGGPVGAALLAATIACAAPPADETKPGGEKPEAPPAVPVPRELPAVVARVNDEAIERWEVDAAVREITLANLHPLPQAERDELVRTVIDRIIEHHLASQIARARGVAATDAEVDEDLRQLRREQPMFDERLKTAGVSLEQLRHQRRLSLDMARLVRGAAAGAVSDAAIGAYYNDNRDRFLLPEAVTASHILIRATPEATPEQRAAARRRAAEIRDQVLGGADFGRTARDVSEDAGSALAGGLVGTFPRGRMDPAFEAAAFSVKPGELSDLVETPFGFHIIRVDEHVAGRMQTLEEVREDIRALLTDRARQEALTKLIEEARRTAKIESSI
jgi:parvulin-like peptidyl-prolyl isomerase